jgi:tetratricopeptide (TPR) repeat protein
MSQEVFLSALDQASVPFVADLFDGTIVSEIWDCDIRSIFHELIIAHNEYLTTIGDPPEQGFQGLEAHPTTLAALVCEDMQRIHRHVPIAVPPEPILVTEINSNTLSAQLLDITVDGGSMRVIGFHSPLMRYINDFFPKFHIMLSDRYARCLPQHRHLLERVDYDDDQLLLSLYNNAEILVNPSASKQMNGPRFLGEPYDLCEQIEGARKFAMLHEFGHAWYRDLKTGKPDPTLDSALAKRFMSGLQYSIAQALGANENSSMSEMLAKVLFVQGVRDPRRVQHFVEELWCDLYAFMVIEKLFYGRLKSAPVTHECCNTLLGIMDLFFMLSIIEKGIGAYDRATSNYPPVDLRAKFLFEYIWSSPLFANGQVCNPVLRRAKSYKAAYQVFCGSGRSGPAGIAKILVALTPFGRQFRQSLFDDILSNHWSSISDAADQLITIEMIKAQGKKKKRQKVLEKLLDRANCHLQEGSAIIAEQSARKVLAFSERDPRVEDGTCETIGLVLLGGALNQQRRHAESEAVLRSAMAKNKHAELEAPILRGLGQALCRLGQYAESASVLRQLLQRLEIGYDHEPIELAGVLNEIGECLEGQDQYAEAEHFHRRALDTLKARTIRFDSSLATSTLILGMNLHRQGASAQAEDVLRNSVEIAKQVFGPSALRTAQAMIWLVASLENQERLPEAEIILRDVIAIREDVLGFAHQDTINGLERLAVLLYEQGKHSESAAIRAKFGDGTFAEPSDRQG